MRTDHDSVPIPQPQKEQILQAAHQTLHQLDHEEALARQQDTADRKTSALLLKVSIIFVICLTLVTLAVALHQHLKPTP